jgi:hypothetical protein
VVVCAAGVTALKPADTTGKNGEVKILDTSITNTSSLVFLLLPFSPSLSGARELSSKRQT